MLRRKENYEYYDDSECNPNLNVVWCKLTWFMYLFHFIRMNS